jgi:hypothetical protein
MPATSAESAWQAYSYYGRSGMMHTEEDGSRDGSKHLENVGEITPPSRLAQCTARAFQHSPSTTSTDQLLIQPRVSLTETLTRSALTLSPYFEATPPVMRQQPVGRVLIPSIRSSADCFREKQLRRRYIHVMSYTS